MSRIFASAHFLILLAPLAAGCAPAMSKPEPSGADTASDTGWEALACGEEVAHGFTFGIADSCSSEPVSDWTLVRRTSVDLGAGYGLEVHTTRTQDVDADGAFTVADPMQVVVSVLGEGVRSYDLDGALVSEVAGSHRFEQGDVAEIDPTAAGAEYLSSWFDVDAPSGVDLIGASGVIWSIEFPIGDIKAPVLTDLEGDGVPELVLASTIMNARTGAVLGDLEGIGPDAGGLAPVAVDLDNDGVREIISGFAGASEIEIFSASGALIATCGLEGAGHAWDAVAVGNLDADPAPEILVGMGGHALICDGDGTIVAELSLPALTQAQIVGIGQLDAEAEPEIVLATEEDLSVYEEDFTLKWTYTRGKDTAYYPFSLADLDGDGIHEIVVNTNGHLFILDADGEELADATVGAEGASSNLARPIITDLDGDGFAEIIASGDGELAIFGNAEGGWPVRGQATPWHGLPRVPHDRDLVGGIPAPVTTWLEEGYNVWQGIPSGPPGRPDLAVHVAEVCMETCDGDASVVVALANSGPVPLFGGATVVLTALDSGEELSRNAIPDTLRAGEGRYVSFEVPVASLAGGLRATAEPVDATDECGATANEDSWTGMECL